MKSEKELISDANDILRSLYHVVVTKGDRTNWSALEAKTKIILGEQHEYLINNACFRNDQTHLCWASQDMQGVCFICKKTILPDNF